MQSEQHAAPPAPPSPSPQLAVVGAGPAGLVLALLAAERLPGWRVSLFDTRAADAAISRDARTLALNLGSVQLLQRLQAWPAEGAEPILAVHVSQAAPTLSHPGFGPGGEPEVWITAREQGVQQLGAVLPYGRLVAPLQARWLALAQAQPQRLSSRFGTAVQAIEPAADSATLVLAEGGGAERFDLVVVAEGGVFAEQARKQLRSDYRQNAWVGSVRLAAPGLRGTAIERFTRNGPLALLPLPTDAQGPRAALVWCMPQAEDEIAELSDAQRLTVIQQRLPAVAGQLLSVGPLKCFALGLNAETRLVNQRAVRIGNAAQTLHPVAGQGLNLGLRDAHALVDALRQPGDAGLDSRLQRIEWQRAPDRWPMIAATDFLARSFAWRWPGLPALRGLALAGLQQAGPIKRALAQRMMFGG